MVKANSLLYAIYICLVVSILCGALLYFSSLYTQLNLHYNLKEELYTNNQSVVNFALGNKMATVEIPTDSSGIEGSYESKPYGLLRLLLAKSAIRNDTVASAHFTGQHIVGQEALYLANFTRPLRYSGMLSLIGDSQLPSVFIETSYLTGKINKLDTRGKVSLSSMGLPEVNPDIKKIFDGSPAVRTPLSDVEKPLDSIYYNSFFNPSKEIWLSNPGNAIFKGNFILRSKDSIWVGKNAILEDVILMAPRIIFEAGFKGTVQAFATKNIEVGEHVSLAYPSVVCVYSDKHEESGIYIRKGVQIAGAVVLFGNDSQSIAKNTVEIEEDGIITGDVYCSGQLMIKNVVHGSVYANKVYHRSGNSISENLLVDVVIDATKRPKYFVGISLFESKKATYGLVKKVL